MRVLVNGVARELATVRLDGVTRKIERLRMDGVDVWTPQEEEPPAPSPVYDDFSGATLDPVKWPTVSRPNLVAVVGGRLRTYFGSNQGGLSYTQVTSPATIALPAGGSVSVHLATAPPSGIAGIEFGLRIDRDANNWLALFAVNNTATTLVARTRSAGVQTQQVLSGVPTTERYWRVREEAGELLYQTGPDRISWTTRHRVPTPFPLTNLSFGVFSGHYGAGSFEDRWMEWGAVYLGA